MPSATYRRVLPLSSGFSAIIGPLIGGLITTYVSWRANFLINIPLGAALLALVLLYIPNHREETRTPFDVKGFLLTAASLMALLYGLERLTLGGEDRLLAKLNEALAAMKKDGTLDAISKKWLFIPLPPEL